MEYTRERSSAHEEPRRIPRKGDRIELLQQPKGVRGTVWHVDQLQVLVKWDDGRSESLRSKFDERFRIVEQERD